MRRKSIYVVVQQGVYIQGVSGPFTLQEARTRARKDADEDRDDYHAHDVYLLKSDGIDGINPLASFRKGDSE